MGLITFTSHEDNDKDDNDRGQCGDEHFSEDGNDSSNYENDDNLET